MNRGKFLQTILAIPLIGKALGETKPEPETLPNADFLSPDEKREPSGFNSKRFNSNNCDAQKNRKIARS